MNEKKIALVERARAFVAGASDPALEKHRSLCAKIDGAVADGVKSMEQQQAATDAMKAAVSAGHRAQVLCETCVDLLSEAIEAVDEVPTKLGLKAAQKRVKRDG